ncbi:TolC family outer membrane protein [Pollutimonas sp. M17]|uniref:TolC family outer membrane protein n=1 Tax=Pollutimonas sp. M17 TaxID=2962065 RepID=UPI0021F3FFCB|nr:TolC family outer membrane protein [Pollutimonas sp. M17]UYO92786.1 TolC family outer membrane protein [Pollutimonas sp. M17]
MRIAATTRMLLLLAMLACLLPQRSQAAESSVRPARQPSNETTQQPVLDLTLVQAWQAALKHDPGYQAAISEREAGQANRGIGRAGLLPQVSASLGRSKLRGTLEIPSPLGGVRDEDLNYTIKTSEIRATQTVFDWSRYAEYRQGHARADHSLAVFDTKATDTATRLFNRYFQALLAHENIVLAQNKLDANEKLQMVARHRFDNGEGTITDIRQAASRRDLSRADLIAARDAMVIAQRELQEMVGPSPLRLAALKPDFQAQPLSPPSLAQWQSAALAGSGEIRSSEQNLRIAADEVDRSFGGHLPTLELVAARRLASNETIATRYQDSSTTEIGVQVSLPIYSGGLTSALVDQAGHNRDRALHELAATRERTAVEVTRQYHAVVSGAQRINALIVAEQSGVQALEAVEAGFAAGTHSMVDILDTQDQLYRSRLDLAQSRLEYVLARLMLSAASGGLDAQLIQRTSEQYFGKGRVALQPPPPKF